MGFWASIDGRVLPEHEAKVSAFDNGFAFGDSVYETLRTYAGRVFTLGRHLARLRRSAGRLGFTIPQSDAEIDGRINAVLMAANNPESYVRLIVSRGLGDLSYHFDRVKGPTFAILVKPLEPFAEAEFSEGIKVALVSIRRNPKWALDPAIKSSNLLNNVLATREAQAQGGSEAILLNERGEIAEGAGSNLFVVQNGTLKTPPLEAGLLEGITRALVLELCHQLKISVQQTSLRAEDLLQAEEAFITSTLKEVMPIARVGEATIGSGKPGPITLRLLAAYREKTVRHDD
jgi:branched-chain amino acid aminotransferase